MAITKTQLKRVLEAINKRFLRFTYDALGERALTEAELDILKEAGVLREGVRHMIADPVAFGRLTAMLPLSASSRVMYSDLERLISRGGEMTNIEKKAVEFATDHAAEYVKGVRDDMLRDVGAATSRSSSEALRAMQEGVIESISNRETVSELKTRLFDIVDDRGRDWYRVAQTEINNSIQHGIYREINEKAGNEQLVFKRPAPDACPYCKKLYLDDEGMPKIFKLKDLADSNFGLKAKDWKPTIGSVHPYCFTDGRVEIFTVDGWRKIKDIKVGDKVLSHKGKFKKVTWIMPSRRLRGEEVVRFRVSDKTKTSELNTYMKVTADHKFLTKDGWVAARDLDGKKVLCLSKKCKECGSYFIWSRDEKEYCSKACASVEKTKHCHNEEAHKKISKSMKSQYKTGLRKVNVEAAHEKTRKMFNDGTHPFQEVDFYHRLNSGMAKRSFLERKVEWFFKQSKIDFKANHPVKRDVRDKLGRSSYFYPDFILDNNIIVECDGEHWHKDIFKRIRRDRELEGLGYTVLHFKGEQIRNDFKSVVEKIERVNKNHSGEYEFHEFDVVDFEKRIGNSQGLFDFEVEDDHSFVSRGVVSHNCRCQLSVVPEGYEFQKMDVVSEKFNFEGKRYLKGEIIPAHVYRRLGTELKDKTRKDAVLNYKGGE